MAENKVTFGLQSVHIAFRSQTSTATTPAWEKPVHIPGAVRWTPTAAGDESTFYADNSAYYRVTANNGYTGELEMANIPDDVKTRMLGWKKDDNGAVVEDSNGRAEHFALLFQVEGDAKARRSVYYDCQATRPAKERTTKGESVEPTTDVLAMTVTPIELAGTMTPMVDLPAGSAAYDKFFDAVYTPVFETTTPDGGAA